MWDFGLCLGWYMLGYPRTLTFVLGGTCWDIQDVTNPQDLGPRTLSEVNVMGQVRDIPGCDGTFETGYDTQGCPGV